jgi:hypothetical protein
MAQVVEVMQWAVIKITFKKAWVWLKTYWQVPFLLVWTLVIYLFARRNTDALLEVLEIKKQSHKEEVEALNKSHKDEILKLKGIQAEYLKTIEQLESKFEEQQRKLSEKQVEHVKEVVIKSKGNPEEIKRKIENEFGIKFKN